MTVCNVLQLIATRINLLGIENAKLKSMETSKPTDIRHNHLFFSLFHIHSYSNIISSAPPLTHCQRTFAVSSTNVTQSMRQPDYSDA